jgi:hypothetical protein
MPRQPNCTCRICGKPIYRRPFEIEKGPVYCSQACFGIGCQKVAVCPVCGKEFLSGRNRKTCSHACANTGRAGVRYKQAGRPPCDRVADSRALKKRLIDMRGSRCQRCGYSDVNILVVHHITRRSDGGTNDLDNLELICPNRHAEIHFYGVKHNQKGTQQIASRRSNGEVAERS